MNSLGTSTSGTVASEDSVVPAYQCTDAKSMPVEPQAPGSTMLFQFVYSVSEWATTMPPTLILESTAFIALTYCFTAVPYAAGESAVLFMRSVQVPDAG